MLLTCVLLAYSFTKNIMQQWAVTITVAFFLFTEAWLALIICGQIYIAFPFLSFIFLYFFRKKGNLLFSFWAGLAAAILFLSRPTTALFFLPLLFLLKRYSVKYLLIFLMPVFVLVGFSLLNKNERNFWLDYRNAIESHIKHHQSDNAWARNDAFTPMQYKDWEGWNEDSINKAKLAYPIKRYFELTGVQLVVKNIFHKKISYTVLNLCSAISIISLMIVFYFRQKPDDSLNIAVTAIFGFCLYMISDFFSPVLRIQYYTVQWIFPLLLLAAFYNPRLRLMYFLLFTGIVLNILNTPYIKMRHTIGEYLILFTLLLLCLSRQSRLLK
jgi:hypothetical protein